MTVSLSRNERIHSSDKVFLHVEMVSTRPGAGGPFFILQVHTTCKLPISIREGGETFLLESTPHPSIVFEVDKRSGGLRSPQAAQP